MQTPTHACTQSLILQPPTETVIASTEGTHEFKMNLCSQQAIVSMYVYSWWHKIPFTHAPFLQIIRVSGSIKFHKHKYPPAVDILLSILRNTDKGKTQYKCSF